MDDMIIEKTQSSPDIHLCAEQNRFLIKGKSYMENSAKFYEPVFDWIEAYLDGLESKHVEVNLEIIYSNSSSFKVFMNLFDMLEEAAGDGKNDITVNWHYDPENAMAKEYGEELQEDLEAVRFILVETSD